ncbi:LPXTG cell wall anchor domain-containing protein [Streptococcus thermophilus]|uniref:LPXTG cell wall anchor domain-containing protein n=1 Tax=Streptococcus thermophilus TaxID=1308 RepID=UPI00355C115D
MTNASASDNNDTVTILHTNDVHGRMVEGDYNGVIGDALLSGIANDTRSKGTTPNGKVFFVSTSNETLKETEKVTETPSQTEELPTTGDKASHAGLLGLDMLLTMFGLSGKHKGKEKN